MHNITTTSADRTGVSAVIEEVRSAPTPAGVDEDVYTELKAELVRVLMNADKTCSGPPVHPTSSPVPIVGVDNVMRWYHTCPGDYDQNGEVNIGDLTPLGMNLSEPGPYDVSSQLYVIDGDGNGELNISDVTPIGTYFGTKVKDYVVYASDDTADYERSATAPATGARELGRLNVGETTADAGMRKQYTVDLSEVPELYTWVAPTDGADEGLPSSLEFTRWEAHTATSILGEGLDGCRSSACIRPDGGLALATVDASNSNLLYTQASTTDPKMWVTPVIVDTDMAQYATPYMEVTEVTDDFQVRIAYLPDNMATAYASSPLTFVVEEVPAGSGSSSIRTPSEIGNRYFMRRSRYGEINGELHAIYYVGVAYFYGGPHGIGAYSYSARQSDMDMAVDDDNDIVHIAFYDDQWLYYAYWTLAEGWVYEQLKDTGSIGWQYSLTPEVCKLPNNGVAIIYSIGKPSNVQMTWKAAGGEWQDKQIVMHYDTNDDTDRAILECLWRPTGVATGAGDRAPFTEVSPRQVLASDTEAGWEVAARYVDGGSLGGNLWVFSTLDRGMCLSSDASEQAEHLGRAVFCISDGGADGIGTTVWDMASVIVPVTEL